MMEKRWVLGFFQMNAWLVACPKTGEAALIDPGEEPAKLLRALAELRTPSGAPVRVKYLLHTHAHLDHIGATRAVADGLVQQQGERPQIALHQADEPLWKSLKSQGEMFGLEFEEPAAIDLLLKDGDALKVGELRIDVIHTPGHSPGGVCYRVGDVVYSGDTLFQGSIGRTDLWGGSSETLLKSIRERLLVLPAETKVCPGHGPATTVAQEKSGNPFL